MEEALINDSFDAAFITSPTSSHITDALYAANFNCHLFIEKPLSHSLEQLNELIEIVRSRRIKGHLGSNWKFHPSFKRIKKILENNEIGKLLSVRCQAGQYLPDWHPWEDYRKGYSANKKMGGGILLDCHEFDYLTWFVGEPEKIACFTDKTSSLEIDTEDVAEVILKFKNGSIGEIHVDYIQRAYQRNYEFFGEEGSLFWNFNSKKVRLYLARDKSWQEWQEPEGYDLNQMYLDQTSHFLNVLADEEKPITPLDRGRDVLSWILAAKQASENNTVIRI